MKIETDKTTIRAALGRNNPRGAVYMTGLKPHIGKRAHVDRCG